MPSDGSLYRRCGWAALLALAPARVALADVDLVPYGSVAYEYNSNVFDLPEDRQAAKLAGIDAVSLAGLLDPPQPVASGDGQRSDHLLRYIAGVETGFAWSDQKLRGLAEGRRVRFSHFDYLDHDEYLLGAGLDWRWKAANGALDYRLERRMAPFAERRSTALAIERERLGTGRFDLDYNPEWRFESVLRTRNLDSPLPGFPDFSLTENSVGVAAKYIEIDALAAGALIEYLSGEFSGVPGAHSFHQESIGVTAAYTIPQLSLMSAELGYTRRTEEGSSGGLSGLTGLFAYHRQFTGKTSAGGQLFRRISSYAGGASGVRDTGAQVDFGWLATEKISVAAVYRWTRSVFDESSGGSQRSDDLQSASLKSTYHALTWLALRPYVSYEERNSNVDVVDYKATIVGLELQARFEPPK